MGSGVKFGDGGRVGFGVDVRVSMKVNPVLLGSSQSLRRESGSPPPSQDTEIRPYQSAKSLPHAAISIKKETDEMNA